MLRTEPQVTANQLLTALELSVHHHREAAAWLNTPELELTAREREGLAEALREQIRRSGDLPDAMDPERTEVSDLGLRARSLLGASGVIEALLHEDESLAQLAVTLGLTAPQFRPVAKRIGREVERGAARKRRAR